MRPSRLVTATWYVHVYIDHFFKLFANPPLPLRIWQLCMQHQLLNCKIPPITIAIYLSPVHSYQNQREVAEGIKRAYKDVPGLKREDLFIVSLIHSWDVTQFQQLT